MRSEEFFAACAALSSQTRAALDFAGLFVEFANPHFFLDAAALDELPEAADGLLGRLLFAKCQLYQRILLYLGKGEKGRAIRPTRIVYRPASLIVYAASAGFATQGERRASEETICRLNTSYSIPPFPFRPDSPAT